MLRRTIVSMLLLFGFTAGAQATLLGITLEDNPDIVSAFIDINYDAGTQSLTADGFALQIDTGGGVFPVAGGLFDLDAVIDNAGNLIGGSFSIFGTIAGLGFNSGTLLTGNLTAFGFPDAGGSPFEFLFNTTGGDAAGLYGSTGGILLSETGFGGDWASDFDNLLSGIPGTGLGVADVAPTMMPLPATFWLVLAGLVAFRAARRRG